MTTTRANRLAIVGGPIVAFVLGAATSSIRDQLGATNVGIALAIVVAAAALVSRGAALTTAVAAALTFNFFHAKPYHSLRISDSRDVAIVALLAVLGLVISDITAWRRRREAIAHRQDRAVEAPTTIGALVAGVHPVGVVWPAVVNAILDQLSLADCGVVLDQPTNLPIISRSVGRTPEGDDAFVLPAKGASIAIQLPGSSPAQGPGPTLGYLVVMPPPGMTSLTVERRVLLALADHLAIALSYGDRPFDPADNGKAVK
ncbi:MAG: sensor histidine kinase [Ilumatobacteraceae bacterium]|nr:sensor histidine kinase [Ilumatobacteraceae bacterium]MCU1389284.1 sensor histidine kinase [Ilumatobacteraceae bacterium]